MKVLAAMSGGVDSSVAAAMMVDEGHDVIGVTLKLWEGPGGQAPTAGCCTLSDAEDARRVAAQLGIPYYVLDYTDEFRAGIVEKFIASYETGRTPNPCVDCNRVVKFDLLLERAAQLDCGLVVTGHYARARRTNDGHQLLRGVDPHKDQSYVLYMLSQEALGRLRFPVGALTKSETRRLAARLGLRTAEKKDSQDVCFVGTGGYRSFLRFHSGSARPGRIVDGQGRVVGRHSGVSDFTIGQRRGIGIALSEPHYVVELRPEDEVVVVGTREDLMATGCRVSRVSWVSGAPPGNGSLEVKLRYRSPAVPARLVPFRQPALVGSGGPEESWDVWFDSPQAAVTPGQAAVLYDGERVLGGGTIDTALR